MPGASALKLQADDDNQTDAVARALALLERGDLPFVEFCALIDATGYTGHIGLDFLHGRPLEYTMGRPTRCKFTR